jgi:hypothetical protein
VANAMPHEVFLRRFGIGHPNAATSTTFTVAAMNAPSVSGTASAQPAIANRMYIRYASATTNGAVAGIAGPYTDVYPAFRPKYSTIIRTDSVLTSRRIWVGLAKASLATLAASTSGGNSTTNFVAVGYDAGSSCNSSWCCCSGNGTNYSCTSMGGDASVAINTEYTITLDWTVSGTLTCTINGVSLDKTTHLSTASTSMGQYNAQTNLATGSRNHYIAKFALEQN